MDERLFFPSFSGIATFLRAPYSLMDEIQPGDYVVTGVPYDVTIGTRPGARYAPNAIREHTKHFIYHLGAIDGEVIDVITGATMTSDMKPIIKDIGDVRVYPTNVDKTTESIASAIETITEKGGFPVSLGGDHYVTFPLVKGFEAGMSKRLGRPLKFGYIHLDSHMDMYDENETWGKYYQGSPARRVSELQGVSMRNMVFVGLHGTTGIEGYRHAKAGGATLFTTKDIREQGMRAIMEQAIAIASKGCDCVYVTLDIDIVDQAYASGTGCVVFGGITADEFLEAAEVMSYADCIGGIDVVEVSPMLDPIGITSRLAANALIEFLKPRLFDVIKGV